jgi:pimeloyl-ACP methyl ester carboxylesterase
MFFGFSAGAHFSHRFALWKPERVKAFVAYSAAWWSEPTPSLKTVPALILCGEADERYPATFDFFRKGHALGCPWIWRSYAQTAHTLTPAVRSMAEAFLAHYVDHKTSALDQRWAGDFQTFKKVRIQEKEAIPVEFRIELPSTEIANLWEKE